LVWRTGCALSAAFTVDDVLAEGFAAVFVGLGLPRSQQLECPHPANVVDGLDFLRQVKHEGMRAPARVAVIGGGNSAMDAATAALQAGARDVYIVYRRSFSELPAWPEERNHALDAGVHFLILAQPVSYLTDDQGHLLGVQVQRTRLGAPDASGRRRPETIPGSEYLLEVDLVVEAIGQLPPADLEALLPGIKLDIKELVMTVPDSTRTSRERVYAGGDIVTGGGTAVAALAAGRQAAEEIAAQVKARV
jgi:glutamate synthase (NADPH/NADH) small chain